MFSASPVVVAAVRRLNRLAAALCALGLFLGVGNVLPATERGDDWPGFRGHGDSIAGPGDYPVTWSESVNIAWRIPLAGVGQGSPIVWRGTVYSLCVEGGKKERLVVEAHDLSTGRGLWKFSTNSALPEAVSDMRSRSAPTPVAGPEGVFAFFESGDCLALDHDGKLIWHRVVTEEVGELTGNHGLGGSPVLASETLVLPMDQERPARLLALDRKTGATRWSAPRPGRTGWSTPIVAGSGSLEQVVVSCGGAVSSYSAKDGGPLWEVGGLIKNLVPSPTLRGDLLVVGAGGKGSNRAFRWDGGTNAPAAAWEAPDVTSGFASPLVHAGRAYFLASAGILSAVELTTGRALFDVRLPDSAWASPVGAGDHVYIFGQRGTTTVIEASDNYRPVATNTVAADSKIVGVAASRGRWIVRAEGELLGIGLPTR
ncbi:MAG: PQQ-binding-like beta-propeller repeat protein [Limisphaerales bacterium]